MPEDPLAEVRAVIDAVREAHAADLLLFAGPLAYQSERRLNEIVTRQKNQETVFLALTTFGGSADVAYQVVRCLQRNYKRFILFVDSLCKSAGTLVALGAHEIVMSDTAEMGPLDIQIQKPGELGEYISGLTSSQALDTLRTEVFSAFENYLLNLRYRSGLQIGTRMAAEIAVRMAVGAFRPIYAQLDPMRIADNMRANMIAHEYGQRIKTENVKDDTIERLIRDYPFHGFVIDREEAKKLFNKVRGASGPESNLGDVFRPLAEGALEEDEATIRLISQVTPVEGDTDEHRDRQAGKVSEASGAHHRPLGEEAERDDQANPGNGTDGDAREATDKASPRDTPADPQSGVSISEETAGAGVEPAPG